MRIIAGEFRGRRLKSVPGMETRPTPDRLRESLFSIIERELPERHFADLYAGTGSVGLEAYSRGASFVTFVEFGAKAAEVLAENIRLLGIANSAKVLRHPARKAVRSLVADIVFLDPPYEELREYRDTLESLAESAVSLVLVQHPSKLQLLEQYGTLTKSRVLRQGDNVVTFYRRAESPASAETPAAEQADAVADDPVPSESQSAEA